MHDKDIIPKDINSEKQIISEEGKDNWCYWNIYVFDFKDIIL